MGLIDLDGLDGTFCELETKVRAELELPSVIVDEPTTVVRDSLHDRTTQAIVYEVEPPPLPPVPPPFISDEPTVLRPPAETRVGRPPSRGRASAMLIGAALGAAAVGAFVLLRPDQVRRPVGSGGVISARQDPPEPAPASSQPQPAQPAPPPATTAPAPIPREPEPEPPLPEPVALPVRFALGERAFDPLDRAQLDESVEDFIVRCRGRVVVTGHTCRLGRERYNQLLGLERARAVRDLLIARGVDPGRVQVQSAGATRPVASNQTAEGRQSNRRVTLACEPSKTEGER